MNSRISKLSICNFSGYYYRPRPYFIRFHSVHNFRNYLFCLNDSTTIYHHIVYCTNSFPFSVTNHKPLQIGLSSPPYVTQETLCALSPRIRHTVLLHNLLSTRKLHRVYIPSLHLPYKSLSLLLNFRKEVLLPEPLFRDLHVCFTFPLGPLFFVVPVCSEFRLSIVLTDYKTRHWFLTSVYFVQPQPIKSSVGLTIRAVESPSFPGVVGGPVL